MHANAAFFRTSFIDHYLNPRNPYPVFTAMYQAGITPIAPDDEAKLGKRGSFIFAGPTAMSNDASSSGICGSDRQVCNSAAFSFQLGGSTSSVTVDFAPRIDVTVTDTSALVFDFGGGVPVHFQTHGTVIPVLRPDMLFRKITVADQFMEEMLASMPGQGSPLTVTVHLALDGVCPANHASGMKSIR